MHLFYSTTLDSNATGEEEDYLESAEEEDEHLEVPKMRSPGTSRSRQAILTCCISDPSLRIACFINVYENAYLYIAIISL
jgi:hypothetical protein